MSNNDNARHGLTVPETGIFDSPTVSVCINERWVAIIDGLAGRLTNPNEWDGTPEARQRGAAEISNFIVALMNRNPCSE